VLAKLMHPCGRHLTVHVVHRPVRGRRVRHAAQAGHGRQHRPGLTRGEGVLESEFHRYAPVRGTPPIRPRSDHNPLDRKEYLLHVVRRV